MKQGFRVKYVQFVPELHAALLIKSRPNVKGNKGNFDVHSSVLRNIIL